MNYGMEIMDGFGRSFNTAEFSCNTFDSFLITSGTSGSKAYPELANRGRTLYAFCQRISGTAGHTANTVTTTYPGGVPTVNWFPLAVGYFGPLTQRVYVLVA